jgi:hypothetical protein
MVWVRKFLNETFHISPAECTAIDTPACYHGRGGGKIKRHKMINKISGVKEKERGWWPKISIAHVLQKGSVHQA